MNDELAVAPDEEPADTPDSPESEANQEPEEGQPDAEPEEGEEEEEQEEEWAEVEYEGRAYVIPKPLEGQFMAQADYSKKTLELSESRKTVEAQQKQIQDYAQAIQEDLDQHVQLKSTDRELESYGQVDWAALRAEDPDIYQEHRARYEDLRYARTDIAQAIQAKQTERTSKATAEADKLEETTQQALVRDIPNYGPQVKRDLVAAGVERGYSAEQVEQALKYDAKAIKTLWEAAQFRKLAAKTKAVPKRDNPVKPVPKVGGRRSAPASNDPKDTDDMDTWRKKRDLQEAKRLGRA